MSDFIGLRHIGLPAKNLAKMAEFYRDVLGMTITRENSADAPYGASVFLARHPDEEDHDLVFFENPALAHTAFRVSSLRDLKAWYRQIKERGLPVEVELSEPAAGPRWRAPRLAALGSEENVGKPRIPVAYHPITKLITSGFIHTFPGPHNLRGPPREQIVPDVGGRNARKQGFDPPSPPSALS